MIWQEEDGTHNARMHADTHDAAIRPPDPDYPEKTARGDEQAIWGDCTTREELKITLFQ